MRLNDLYRDNDYDAVLVPKGRYGQTLQLIDRYAYVLPMGNEDFRIDGIVGHKLRADDPAWRFFTNAVSDDRFTYMRLKPYDRPSIRVDLSLCNRQNMRLLDDVTLIHKGRVPAYAVTKLLKSDYLF